MAGPMTPVEARGAWKDAPADDARLTMLLNAAADAVFAYAPALPDPAEWPDSYRLAQVMQARSIANAGVAAAGGGDADGSGYGISVFPLDWSVQQLLRPRRAMGAVV